jgi:hypothetical protein
MKNLLVFRKAVLLVKVEAQYIKLKHIYNHQICFAAAAAHQNDDRVMTIIKKREGL